MQIRQKREKVINIHLYVLAMLRCPKCKKEVLTFSISSGAPDSDKIADSMQSHADKEGKLIIMNPPPFGKLKCPVCFSDLTN